MRILYLSHILPISETTGDLRHYRFLKGLARRNLVRLFWYVHRIFRGKRKI